MILVEKMIKREMKRWTMERGEWLPGQCSSVFVANYNNIDTSNVRLRAVPQVPVFV